MVHKRTKKLILLLMGTALLAAGHDLEDGLTAYSEGRFRAAMKQFQTATVTEPGAELYFNQALAALRAGEYAIAETAAEKAAALGGEVFVSRRDFLQGNIAYGRGELAATQAATPGAPPFAHDAAIALVERAMAAWQSAAMSRPDWPAARRNFERAMVRRAQLVELKAKARKQQARKAGQVSRPRLIVLPNGSDPGKNEIVEKAPTAQADGEAMTVGRIKRVFSILAEKEKVRRKLRQSQRRQRQGKVERDW